ncbi:hypothetical protein CROQUDRAFT_130388 [Cronartium quercuum f. sp. fusiforme G11]|uniref:Timeless N-terminal domain-containing protein n=1 Tax=Cronartium quercuum f. sp. fusiforme G11 TaxID=708437 RepID=A0A9P6NPJ3_9BASI|nr:hypothetical protein CROQUDRAFT_130388 [Cronartium quercuum f. sp. fusiforme G11]
MPPKKAELKVEISKAHQARSEHRKVLEPAILALVSALGGYEEVVVESEEKVGDEGNERAEANSKLQKVYKLGDECLGCLKDLKKWWRLDEENDDRTVARVLFDSQILPNDLIPILTSVDLNDKKDMRVALLCCDLVSALTWPIDIASELKEINELEDEEEKRRLSRIDFSGLIAAQQSYKRDILRSGSLAHIFKLIVPSLQKGKRERTEKDENIISMILHVIRNLVALRDKPPPIGESSLTTNEYQLQSDLIMQMSQFGIFDFLIHLSHGANRFDAFGTWNIIVLDIWHLLFRGIDAEDLIDSESFTNINDQGQTVSTLSTSARKLENLLAEEEREKRRQARKAPTRHSRFGTTISVHTGDRKYNLHRQSDITAPVEQALDSGKKQKRKSIRLKDEFGPSTELTPDAMKVLRKVAIEFVESAFNPFFGSILQDIRMERDKVRETDTIRFMLLFGFFLQYFMLLRDREKQVGIPPESEDGHDFDLIASLIEPSCIRYTLSRIQANVEQKPMPVVEVHAAVNCMIHQLLVIDGLMTSGTASYVEAANLIQDKLYYDETSMEVVTQLLCCFTTQSHRFLDKIVFLASVFLRMLERYSKNADYMFVRKKKPTKKSDLIGKGKSTDGEHEDAEAGLAVADEEQAEFEAMEDRQADTYADHKFEFDKFQARFAREQVLNTLMVYLTGHRDFTSPEQVKRVVRLLYRIAVNAKAESLFFKVSILNTFNTILDDRTSLLRNPAYDDLWKLIDYVLKQFFKAVRQNPLLLVENLFPHRQSKGIEGISKYVNSDSDADSLVLTKPKKKPLKLPAEIVIKPGLTWSQRLGVAVGLLVDHDKSHLIESVKDVLRIASAARTAIVLITDGTADGSRDVELQAWLDEPKEEISDALKAQLSKPSQAALDQFEDHGVNTDDVDFQRSLQRDAELHVLLRLLGWSSAEGEPGHLDWRIPKGRLHTELDVDIKVIDYFLLNPLDHNGKSAAELVKRKRRKRAKRTRRSRRASEELNDEERALDSDSEEEDSSKKREAKKQQEIKTYQSAQFIADSDDEDNPERDARFFEQERLLRERINQGALLGMGVLEADANTISTRKTRPKQARKKNPKRASLSKNQNQEEDEVAGLTATSAADSDMDILEDGEPDEQPGPTRESTIGVSPDEEMDSMEESDAGQRTARTTTTTPLPFSTPSDNEIDKSSKFINKKRTLGSPNPDGEAGSEDEVDELEDTTRPIKSRRVFLLESDEE